MKILMVDKYYFIKGGAERYYFELKKLLEAKGHEVIPFAMRHPQNFDTPFAENFVENIEFNDLSTVDKIRHAPPIISRVIYSRAAKTAVAKLIDKVKPDLAHIHMIDHQISPSILHAFRDHGIPVVQTCHQYKLVCPSYRLFIMHKNRICEKCVNGSFYHAVFERCHKNSLAASALVTLESYVHRLMKIYDLIDIYHVPSRFLGEKLLQAGFPRERIWHNFYTINLDDYPYHPQSADYLIYYGRLSEEKGVLTLLKAMCHVPEAKLYIVGEGPQRPVLEDFVNKKQLKTVRFWGNQQGEALVRLVQQAKFVVVPSEWYDNSPLVIYESFSMGKPVIASTMGGMPELVDDGENGFHFAPGNTEDLADKIRRLWQNSVLCKTMGKNARYKAEAEFSPEAHYTRIMELYEKLVTSKRKN
ncbi:MAG: glycosyltransferase family 4 protein [candidate division KSB1 bacterium]|nr:glycosyltransferase family 4 protein [candidate division KSB1 bacterium]MDZ7300905.1 glycosyltransferase family 4 protein [candidate division KSB1 bacterium]MDZ7314057.1 glycosyltransferase family 4 protein [candidate division KSB1 bacterium]